MSDAIVSVVYICGVEALSSTREGRALVCADAGSAGFGSGQSTAAVVCGAVQTVECLKSA